MISTQTSAPQTLQERWQKYLHLEPNQELYEGSNVLVGKGHAKMHLAEGHSKVDDLVVNDGTLKIIGLPLLPETGVRSALTCKHIYVLGEGKLEVENAHLNFRYCVQMSHQQFSKAICGWSPPTNFPSPQKIPQTAFNSHFFTVTGLVDPKVHNVIACIVKGAFRGDIEFTTLFVSAGSDREPKGQQKTALMLAAEKNQTPAIRTLVLAGARIQELDSFGNTALHIATLNKRDQATECLLTHKADPYAQNYLLKTPITYVVDSGSRKLINLLTENGVDLSRDRPLQGCISAEMMHAAVNGETEKIERLLARGTRINEANARGDTMLILAAKYGHLKVVELLIRMKADLVVQGTEGSAVDWAIRRGHAQVLFALLSAGAPTHEIDLDQLEALGRTKNHSEVLDVILQIFIKTKPNLLQELLATAAQNGHRHILTSLLSAGANPNELYLGHSVLAHAAMHGQREVLEILRLSGSNEKNAITSLIKSGQLQALKLLVRDEAEVARKNLDDETLLFYAAMTGSEKMLQPLLSKIDLNTTNDAGETPLMCAARNDQRVIAKMLLKANANPNVIDPEGKTAIDHASIRGHLEMVELILHTDDIEPQNFPRTLDYVHRAYIYIRKSENPSEQVLATKYQKIKSILGNAIADATPSAPTIPRTQKKITWAEFLPTVKSPNFEALITAKTVEEVCEALDEIHQSLIESNRPFSPPEELEFAAAKKNPIFQNHKGDQKITDLLSLTATTQQRFLKEKKELFIG